MALKIYGQKQSRALRCVWLLEELGVPYEHIPINQNAGENRRPEFLAINPAGKIPVLDHDGFILTESMAINGYLAATFPTDLLPRGTRELALLQQWTLWAATEIEPHLVAVFKEGRRSKEEQDAARVTFWRSEAQRAMATTLEPRLAAGPWLLGTQFSLADLNAAAILSSAPLVGVDMTSLPNTAGWMKRCFERDAFRRTQARA